MALRQIRVMGDEVLTKQCREVKEMTPRLKTLISDMFETMYDACGVGLAAPQVGILKRIFVVDHIRRYTPGVYQPLRSWKPLESRPGKRGA